MALHEKITTAWRPVGAAAQRTAPDLLPAERVNAWAECASYVREMFAAHAGDRAVAEWFNIPAEYATFMELIGGGWSWENGLQQDLFSAPVVSG